MLYPISKKWCIFTKDLPYTFQFDPKKFLKKISWKIMTPEILWIPFGIFSKLITSIESNVPHKIITYKHCFPWVIHNLRKLINKKNKAYNNRKKHPGKFKKLKNAVQKELEGSVCIRFPQSRMKCERHRLRPLSLYFQWAKHEHLSYYNL